MIFYYGGKFNPWTKGHMSVLKDLCHYIQDNYKLIEEKYGKPKIIIGVKSGELEGSGSECGRGIMTSVMHRKSMVREAINGLQNEFPFLVEFGSYTSNDKIDVEEQTIDRTWDYFNSKPMWWPDNGKVTIVMGEDEHQDLVLSSEGSSDRWMHAREILDKWPVMAFPRDPFVSSTRVREIFRADPFVQWQSVSDYLEKPVYDYIVDNMLYWQYPEDEARREETVFLHNYDMSKFPRPSCTATVAVTCCGKILLVRRKGHPFRDYWAMPGGFFDVDKDESLVHTAQRELSEETGLGCPPGMFKLFDVFSEKWIDPRGRIVDTVFHVDLGDKFWETKAGDDAAELMWWPVGGLPKMAFHHRKVVEFLASRMTEDKE